MPGCNKRLRLKQHSLWVEDGEKLDLGLYCRHTRHVFVINTQMSLNNRGSVSGANPAFVSHSTPSLIGIFSLLIDFSQFFLFFFLKRELFSFLPVPPYLPPISPKHTLWIYVFQCRGKTFYNPYCKGKVMGIFRYQHFSRNYQGQTPVSNWARL